MLIWLPQVTVRMKVVDYICLNDYLCLHLLIYSYQQGFIFSCPHLWIIHCRTFHRGGQKEAQFHFVWASRGSFSTNRGSEVGILRPEAHGCIAPLHYSVDLRDNQLTSDYCRKTGNGTMCYPHTCEARRESVSHVEVQRFSKAWSPVQFVKSINKKIYSNGLHISRKLVRVTRKAKSKGRVFTSTFDP